MSIFGHHAQLSRTKRGSDTAAQTFIAAHQTFSALASQNAVTKSLD
jgi:hypothetical protein